MLKITILEESIDDILGPEMVLAITYIKKL